MGALGQDVRGSSGGSGTPGGIEDRYVRSESGVDFSQSKENHILGGRHCLSKDLYEKDFGVNPGTH